MSGAPVDRRSLLMAAATGLLVVGVGYTAVGLFKAMSPAAGDGPANPPVRYPLSELRVGQTVNLTWAGKPIQILHRSPADIAWLMARPLAPPGGARPSFRATPLRSLTPDYFVYEAACTRDRCVVARDDPGDAPIRGLACPCCGSRYDLAGRVTSGPATRSLAVPPYHFEGADLIVIGEDQV